MTDARHSLHQPGDGAHRHQLGRKPGCLPSSRSSTFTEVLGDLVVKPVGKPTFVPDSDKRPALDIHSAESEFTKTSK
ncbi:DUF2800 domain-containing protein [Corynebacterium freneyi]|uniref:DUF2800 domain-containing protein n=1 Tax=Corynebacterium freneyi TaxID=134034 RepID=UPI0030B88BD0